MQGEAASFSRLAFYGNRTAHFLHQALDIEKAETIALDRIFIAIRHPIEPVSYTHLRAHETSLHLVCRLLLEHRMNQEPEDESQDEHDEERCGKDACHLAEHSHRKRL